MGHLPSISSEIKDKHSETFTAVSQTCFMSFESSKKFGLLFDCF